MDLKADLWFPSIVFAGYVESIDRNSLKQIALAWQAKEPNLGGNSNMNGWHSRSIENLNLVDPNYVFAFNGDFLPSFSKSCNGFVYAFEPVLENYIMSKLTIEKNNLENVFLYNAALGEKTETLRINTNLDKDYHIGDASKIDSEGDLCLALAIDDFSYSSLMLIQLDIEGFELNALKGAEKTIKKHHPMIAIEDNKGDCKEFLESLGYVSPVAIPGLDIYVHEQQTLHLEKLKNINSN